MANVRGSMLQLDAISGVNAHETQEHGYTYSDVQHRDVKIRTPAFAIVVTRTHPHDPYALPDFCEWAISDEFRAKCMLLIQRDPCEYNIEMRDNEYGTTVEFFNTQYVKYAVLEGESMDGAVNAPVNEVDVYGEAYQMVLSMLRNQASTHGMLIESVEVIVESVRKKERAYETDNRTYATSLDGTYDVPNLRKYYQEIKLGHSVKGSK